MTRRIIQQLCRHTRHWSLPILNGRWRVCFRCGVQQRYFKRYTLPCCSNERRNMNGGCDNCGDPCL